MSARYFLSFLGKSLICKERTMRTGNENPAQDAYYISLVGSYKNGSPRREPFIFDLITKEVEMKKSLQMDYFGLPEVGPASQAASVPETS